MPKQLKRTNHVRIAPYQRAAMTYAAKGGYALARYGVNRAAGAIQKWWRGKKALKKRSLNKDIRPVGTGASQSFFKKSYKARLPVKILKNLTPIRCDVETSAEKLRTVAYGKQTATQVAQFTSAKIDSIFANLVDYNTSKTQSVLLRSIEQEYMISNASSANVFIKLYEITARNDIKIDGNSPTLAQALYSAVGAFDQGVYDINTGMDAMTLGVTPFQSKMFTQNFKVDKIYHIELGAGRTHKHLSRFSPNRIVHESRSSRTNALEAITRYVVILAFGSPINDTTTTTAVSTSLVNLNIVRKQVTKIQFMNPQGAVYYNTQGLGIVAQAEHVDEEGNVQNEVEA